MRRLMLMETETPKSKPFSKTEIKILRVLMRRGTKEINFKPTQTIIKALIRGVIRRWGRKTKA